MFCSELFRVLEYNTFLINVHEHSFVAKDHSSNIAVIFSTHTYSYLTGRQWKTRPLSSGTFTFVVALELPQIRAFFALHFSALFRRVFCVYSVLGMHLFGGKFCRHVDDQHICTCSEILSRQCTCNRKNFDTLHWSLVTVFQVNTNLLFYSFSLDFLFLG